MTSDVEHFDLSGPLRASGAKVVTAPEDSKIVEAVSDRTRLVAISHVSWVTGNSLDPAWSRPRRRPADPGRRRQSSSGSSRFKRATSTTTRSRAEMALRAGRDGTLVVARPDRLQVALPSYFAQLEHQPDGSYVPREGAERFDSGWIGTPSLAGLSGALDVHPSGASSAWPRWPRSAAPPSRKRFEVVTKPGQAGLVHHPPDERPDPTRRQATRRRRDRARAPGPGLVEVSCGYWTSDDDLERLLGGLA